MALAPISLGNPAAAATLRTRHAEQPAPAAAAAPATYIQTLRVGNGDTLAVMLREAGVPGGEAHAAIAALGEFFDPRRIRPGQDVVLVFRTPMDGPLPGLLLGLRLAVDFAHRVEVARTPDGGFAAMEVEKVLTRDLAQAAGEIGHSLFVDGDRAGVPVPVLIEMIRAYSWDVDFQREVRPGDRFEVVYERFHDEDGEIVHNGNIVFADFELSGQRHPIYRHTTTDGATDYFDQQGRSVRKALMRTPIDGARLSSGFGRRKHPILGYTKVHRGIDFAAPTGTPIYAAGNGVIEFAGRNGSYGNYIRIRHNSQYSTAYGHLSRYARGMTKGRRVEQGQVIAYVGTTGRSTGPHLHYEIMEAGSQVNPLAVKMPSGRRLEGDELERFQVARRRIDDRIAALATAPELASRAP